MGPLSLYRKSVFPVVMVAEVVVLVLMEGGRVQELNSILAGFGWPSGHYRVTMLH